MSGAGRSSAADVLEDLEYVVIDNLPRRCWGRWSNPRHPRAAHPPRRRHRLPLGPALRGDQESLRASVGTTSSRIVFLDADDDVIIKRYRRTDVPTPRARHHRRVDRRREEMTEPLRRSRDVVIDTSNLNVHELRQRMTTLFSEGTGSQADAGIDPVVRVQARHAATSTCSSTSGSCPIPTGSDLRPGRHRPGRAQLRHGVGGASGSWSVWTSCSVPHPEVRGRGQVHYLSIGIGCTGVTIAPWPSPRRSPNGYRPTESAAVQHRDIHR